MSIYIERNRKSLTYLNVHLRNTIFTKHIEHHVTRKLTIAVYKLKDIILRGPSISATTRSTTTFFKNLNNFTCNFHLYLLF